MDAALQVNMVWSADGTITHEEIPPVPPEIAALMEDVSQTGKLLE
jgi:succinate dehydrogenase / fumarate reductase flavoprotein subunit